MSGPVRIFTFWTPIDGWNKDILANALSEYGEGLGSHMSSSESWAQYDIGERRASRYSEWYPNGYELVWLGKLPKEGDNVGFDLAWKRNNETEGVGIDYEAKVPSPAASEAPDHG